MRIKNNQIISSQKWAISDHTTGNMTIYLKQVGFLSLILASGRGSQNRFDLIFKKSLYRGKVWWRCDMKFISNKILLKTIPYPCPFGLKNLDLIFHFKSWTKLNYARSITFLNSWVLSSTVVTMTKVGSTESGHGCAVANVACSQRMLLIKLLLFPDAEPKYLIVVRPAPPPSQKKSCSGTFHSLCFY